ncbi:MAG: CPBP family intramembrane glutamic endopeptidase [Pirellulales bacterium]
MSEQPDDLLLIIFAGVSLLISLMVCVVLVGLRSRGPLVAFRPRRPVPWNVFGALLAPFLVLLSILAVAIVPAENSPPVTSEKAAETAAESKSEEQPHAKKNCHSAMTDAGTTLFLGAVQEVAMVGGVLILIVAYFKATPADLGIDLKPGVFARDVAIGVVVGIAALAPIRLVQWLLLFLAGQDDMSSGHPLVKMLQQNPPSVIVLLLATLMAVVVAPLCEEITFRLLLQGWLEKWEFGKLRPPAEESADGETSLIELQPLSYSSDGTVVAELVAEAAETVPTIISSPPPHGIAGWSFGIVPIFVSSLLFGLAHFGYGPEPVSLFFLAIMLGYVYFRTHSIVPTIVAHAVFNSFTMLVLWRLWFIAAG